MAKKPDPQLLLDFERVLGALNVRAGEAAIEPDLSRIAALMDFLGSPQLAYRVVHVAGTNGKTTTSRMIEALLSEAGLGVGLTTSPHLHDVRERIRIHGEPVSLEGFVGAYDDIAPFLDLVQDQLRGAPLTYFEVLTAMAFAAFAEAPVDAAVVEVGMGGRWDSSNVVQPDVVVITPIGLDHQQFLGETIREIAWEKAGVIKPGTVVVCAEQQQEAMEVIAERCAEVGAALLVEGVDFGLVERAIAVGGAQLTIRGLGGEYQDVVMPLHGRHQARNATLALAAVEAFFGAGVTGRRLDPDLVQAAFARVTSPGRLEVMKRNPTVILDAAHNPHGAQSLATAIVEEFAFDRLCLVVGIFADKDVAGFLEVLEPLCDHLVCAQSSSPRALPAEELAEQAGRLGFDSVEVKPKLIDALDAAVAYADAFDRDEHAVGIVVCGSVVTISEARALLGRHTA